MDQQSTSQFARPRIDVRALLGLYDPADSTDWGPIRAAQVNTGRKLALFLLAANLVAALAVAMVMMKVVPVWQLASWGPWSPPPRWRYHFADCRRASANPLRYLTFAER